LSAHHIADRFGGEGRISRCERIVQVLGNHLRVPSWIAAAINEQVPDILVLTEYVEGPDHDFFLAGLNANGLSEFSCSTQPGRENQVLIASRNTQRQYDLAPPDIHPSVPSNSLEVWFGNPELAGLGFRMPAFAAKERGRRQKNTPYPMR
jgi:hypothetical protein